MSRLTYYFLAILLAKPKGAKNSNIGNLSILLHINNVFLLLADSAQKFSFTFDPLFSISFIKPLTT